LPGKASQALSRNDVISAGIVSEKWVLLAVQTSRKFSWKYNYKHNFFLGENCDRRNCHFNYNVLHHVLIAFKYRLCRAETKVVWRALLKRIFGSFV